MHYLKAKIKSYVLTYIKTHVNLKPNVLFLVWCVDRQLRSLATVKKNHHRQKTAQLCN